MKYYDTTSDTKNVRVPAESDLRYIKHVHCDGARWHVLSYHATKDGARIFCTEPDCIYNKPENSEIKA